MMRLAAMNGQASITCLERPAIGGLIPNHHLIWPCATPLTPFRPDRVSVDTERRSRKVCTVAISAYAPPEIPLSLTLYNALSNWTRTACIFPAGGSGFGGEMSVLVESPLWRNLFWIVAVTGWGFAQNLMSRARAAT